MTALICALLAGFYVASCGVSWLGGHYSGRAALARSLIEDINERRKP